MNYKILIITTEGCEACNIAVDKVSEALSQTSKHVYIEVNDFHNVPRTFIVKNKIKDYPTVVYLINDDVVCKAVGTYPVSVYLRWIDLYFK